MTYHFTCKKEDGAFWGECRELKGCFTQADTKAEFKKNCEEALNLYLDEPSDSKIIFPLPNEALDGDRRLVKADVEPEIAFAVLLRNYRLSHNMTQREAAESLEMKNIYSYQKLERRSNPTLGTIARIAKKFPGFDARQIFAVRAVSST